MNIKFLVAAVITSLTLIGCGEKSSDKEIYDQLPKENKSIKETEKGPSSADDIFNQIPDNNKSIK